MMLFFKLVWNYFTDLEVSPDANFDAPAEAEDAGEWNKDYFYNPTSYPGDGQFPTPANDFTP